MLAIDKTSSGIVNLSLLFSRVTNVGIWTYECHATLLELHLAPCMHDVYRVCRLESSHTSKQNFLSLILLILLSKLMNQKRDICRCYILYPLRLGPPFPNDAKILRPKVGLGPNQMLIDLRNVKIKNITFYEKINYFWKIKGHGNPRPVHASTDLHTQARCIRM